MQKVIFVSHYRPIINGFVPILELPFLKRDVNTRITIKAHIEGDSLFPTGVLS
jgi:hypothetical protein